MNRYCNPPTKATYRSPVYDVRAVPVEKVVANSYNPNVVAPPEMKLLELSIWEDGYTMPCVCYYDAEKDLYELVDGYHRYLVLKRSKRIYERERGLLPVAVIEKDLSNRMASTIRHNRARGTHNVELMSEIVAELTRAQMSDQWIMRHIGMNRDELLRLKQITGLAELFADKEFSPGDTEEEAVEPARIMRWAPRHDVFGTVEGNRHGISARGVRRRTPPHTAGFEALRRSIAAPRAWSECQRARPQEKEPEKSSVTGAGGLTSSRRQRQGAAAGSRENRQQGKGRPRICAPEHIMRTYRRFGIVIDDFRTTIQSSEPQDVKGRISFHVHIRLHGVVSGGEPRRCGLPGQRASVGTGR